MHTSSDSLQSSSICLETSRTQWGCAALGFPFSGLVNKPYFLRSPQSLVCSYGQGEILGVIWKSLHRPRLIPFCHLRAGWLCTNHFPSLGLFAWEKGALSEWVLRTCQSWEGGLWLGDSSENKSSFLIELLLCKYQSQWQLFGTFLYCLPRLWAPGS